MKIKLDRKHHKLPNSIYVHCLEKATMWRQKVINDCQLDWREIKQVTTNELNISF